jgi:hypothetical protein
MIIRARSSSDNSNYQRRLEEAKKSQKAQEKKQKGALKESKEARRELRKSNRKQTPSPLVSTIENLVKAVIGLGAVLAVSSVVKPLDLCKMLPADNPEISKTCKEDTTKVSEFFAKGSSKAKDWAFTQFGSSEKVGDSDPLYSKESIQKVIDHYAKGKSPITAQMIIDSSKKTETPIEFYLVMGISESHFGTNGSRTLMTKNVYNVGNVDNGANEGQSSWEKGLDRFGKLIKSEYFDKDEVPDFDKFIKNDFRRPSDNARYMSNVDTKTTIPQIQRDVNKLLKQYDGKNNIVPKPSSPKTPNQTTKKTANPK